MPTFLKYASFTDKEIVCTILSGNEEIVLYLLYDKFAKDIHYFVWKYFENLDIIDDLISDLYAELKGKNQDWEKFRQFEFRSSLRTWMSSVISNFCKEKRRKMIDEARKNTSINIATVEYVRLLGKENPDPRIAIMLEAINRLENETYRFIIIKDLEGYSHKDIAQMIQEKRRREGKIRTYNGKEVVYDAFAVDRDKARATKEIKKIMQQLMEKQV